MKHTPTPWVYEYGSVYNHLPNGETVRLILADREEIGTSPAERDENLRFTAEAVNHHEELVKILSTLVKRINENTGHDLLRFYTDIATDVLAKINA